MVIHKDTQSMKSLINTEYANLLRGNNKRDKVNNMDSKKSSLGQVIKITMHWE